MVEEVLMIPTDPKAVDMRVAQWIISMKISTIPQRSLLGKSLELTVSETGKTKGGEEGRRSGMLKLFCNLCHI